MALVYLALLNERLGLEPREAIQSSCVCFSARWGELREGVLTFQGARVTAWATEAGINGPNRRTFQKNQTTFLHLSIWNVPLWAGISGYKFCRERTES